MLTEQEKQDIRNELDKAKEHHDLFRVPYNDAIKVCERLIDALDERDRELERLKQEREQNKQNFVSSGDTLFEVRKKNERLQKALEFYANDDNWRGGLRMSSSINCDGGDIARRALETEKE